MSDSVAILSNRQIKEKKHLLNTIKNSAEKLRLDCAIASNKYKFFTSETIELIDKYFNLSNEIVAFCEYEANNQINIEAIKLADFNKGKN